VELVKRHGRLARRADGDAELAQRCFQPTIGIPDEVLVTQPHGRCARSAFMPGKDVARPASVVVGRLDENPEHLVERVLAANVRLVGQEEVCVRHERVAAITDQAQRW
jgi:hypothetical protein